MKKCLLTFLLLASLLCSCSIGIFDDSDKKADVRFEQILEALKNEDKETLNGMFSNKALSEADDFNSSLDALFQYVQGSIQSWESTGAYVGSDDKNSDGTRIKRSESAYLFTTSDKHKYQIAIYEYTIDTVNPNNVGIYSLCIIRAEDNENSEFVFWGSGKAGINIGN